MGPEDTELTGGTPYTGGKVDSGEALLVGIPVKGGNVGNTGETLEELTRLELAELYTSEDVNSVVEVLVETTMEMLPTLEEELE